MYVLTKCNLVHENHPISKEIFMHHPTQRKLTAQEQKEALEMYKANGDVKLIAQTMSQKTGKVVLTKDIHNVKTKFSENGEINRLQTIINQRIEFDKQDNFVFGENEEESKIYMIFYQNKQMKDMYIKYPEILFIDGTYSLNRNNYPLYLFVVRDSNGNGQIVGFAIIAYERIHFLNTIFQCFADNQDVSATKAVMIDKDLTEWMLLKHHFISADIYLCKFHCIKIFERVLKNKSLLEHLTVMLESKTEHASSEAYKTIQSILETDSRDKEYLQKNWFDCQEMWVKHLRSGKFTCDSDTNNYVETLNKSLKTFIKKNTTLDQCLDGVFNLLNFMEKQMNYKTYKQMTSITINHKKNQDEIYSIINRVCTPFASKIVTEQYELSINNQYKIEEFDDLIKLISKFSYNLKFDKVSGQFSCDCFDFSTNNLPCRHVLYVRKYKNLPIVEPNMICERWKHVVFRSTITSETDSSNLIVNSNGRRTIQMQNMNRIASTRSDFLSPTKTRFIECKRILNRLGEIVSRDSEDTYNYRLQTLLQITDLWEKNETFTIKPIQEVNQLNQRVIVNNDDLSRYESLINAEDIDSNVSANHDSNSNSFLCSTATTSSQSSSTTNSLPTSSQDIQSGCFVKINLNGRSLVKSAPKRGAPTKAQRKRKAKDSKSNQNKKSRCEMDKVVDQDDNSIDESTSICKICDENVSKNSLVCCV
ncbi:unnamed protein product, partial [Brachionus calyciflorus]